MNLPLVSVCVANYNGAKFIEETLRSLIRQTYQNIEIIVGDNVSTDQSVAIIKKIATEDSRIKYFQNKKNIGYSGNCNKLIQTAQGKYVTIYHSDDVYEPTIVEEEVAFLEANPELAGVYTSQKVIDENRQPISNDGFILNQIPHKYLILDLVQYLDYLIKQDINPIVCPTSMIKKSVYQELKGYDLNLKYVDDVDMWLRILEKYNVGIVNKKLVNYRVHSAQGSQYYRDLERDDLLIPIKFLAAYIEKNSDLKDRYKIAIKRLIALDYNKIIKNYIILGQREKLAAYLKLSRNHYRFFFPSKDWFVQQTNFRFIYLIVRLYLLLNPKRQK
ncbi:glycosyltransferase [bacterium]|jgi:GT2 family glycosyltransferase|nr:glycosyltransferase [bacterium]MBT3580784.1 glycosyltransferase [bacterium]MBT4551635.1 glycosyltransferase [bacterium]MBT5988733.1 glycosyltransferase [bacterium]MBT7088025.1 glycosyltransferase [bacterium]